MNGDTNGPDQRIENELRSLRPKPLSDTARSRVLSAIGRDAGKGALFRHRRFALAALAASIVVAAVGGLWVRHGMSPGPAAAPTATAPGIRPFAAGTVLVKQEDQGTVCLGEHPVRKIRCLFVDSVAWRNPGDQVTVALRPRVEVAYVALPTY